MSNMLRKKANCFAICTCNKHHKPTISWGKKERHQARAVEKRQVSEEIKDEV